MWKNYVLNFVTLCSWLPTHVTYFIVFAIKQVISAPLEKMYIMQILQFIFYKQGFR